MSYVMSFNEIKPDERFFDITFIMPAAFLITFFFFGSVKDHREFLWTNEKIDCSVPSIQGIQPMKNTPKANS